MYYQERLIRLLNELKSNNITDFYNAVDGDETTYASVPNTTGKRLVLCLDGVPRGATPQLLTVPDHDTYIYGIFDEAIVSSDSFIVYYAGETGIPGTPVDVPASSVIFSLNVPVVCICF